MAEAELSMPPNCWFCPEALACKIRTENSKKLAENSTFMTDFLDLAKDDEDVALALNHQLSLELSAQSSSDVNASTLKTLGYLARIRNCPGPQEIVHCGLESFRK